MTATHASVLATAVVIALLVVQIARELPVRVSESARNVALTHAEVTGNDSDTWRQPLAAGCQDYIQAITRLNDQVLAPEQLLAEAEGWSSCWPDSRKRLLQARLVGAMASLGQWNDVCLELSSVQAVDRLLTMAEQAAEEDNWEVVSRLLTCLEQVDWGEAWISPWRVAVLYQQLGQHLESLQVLAPAVAAYQRAADWHPGVWAVPYLQAASLLWRQGRTDDALNQLIAALDRNPDDTAAFELWHQLADYWDTLGDQMNSLCAYRAAGHLLERSPALSTIDVTKVLQAAEAASALTDDDCFQDIPALHAR